jgi:predicted chitinase
LQLYLPHLNQAMQRCGVDTPLRVAAFIAQLAHESGEFRWMEEIWGPTPAQTRYEPPGGLAQRLGNTQPGDGERFKGRGPIQITGRFNYQKYGDLLTIDLTADPTLAAAPEHAFATAGLFWQSNGLNELADAQQFVSITRRINGGTNGLDDRQKYYERAKAALAVGVAARGGPPVVALTRGAEAIRAAQAAAPKRKPAAAKRPAAAAKKAAAKKPVTKKSAPKKPAARKPASSRRAAA